MIGWSPTGYWITRYDYWGRRSEEWIPFRPQSHSERPEG